jgi:hypothetical protein
MGYERSQKAPQIRKLKPDSGLKPTFCKTIPPTLAKHQTSSARKQMVLWSRVLGY